MRFVKLKTGGDTEWEHTLGARHRALGRRRAEHVSDELLLGNFMRSDCIGCVGSGRGERGMGILEG